MMNRGLFLLVVLGAMLAGCRSASVAQPTRASTPSHYWTALEAYEQIKPAMLAWHEDAVVFRMGTTRDPHWQIRVDGKAPWWVFTVYSSSAQKATEIALIDDEVVMGIDGRADHEIPMTEAEELPLYEIVDSSKAVEIAAGNGVKPDDVLVEIFVNRFNSRTGEYIPASWHLVYEDPSARSKERWIFINLATGEVLWNDYVHTPTPGSQP